MFTGLALPSQVSVSERVVYAILNGGSLVLIEGVAGVGKSTVLRNAALRLKQRGHQVAWTTGSAASSAEIAARLLASLRGDYRFHNHGSEWRALRDELTLARLQEQPCLLVVDDLPPLPDCLVPLREVGAMAGGWAAVLCALREPIATRDRIPSWAREADAWFRVPPLTRSEALELLTFLQGDDPAGGPTIDRDAATRAHAIARAVPRSLIRLARAAREAARQAGAESVTAEIVELTAATFAAA